MSLRKVRSAFLMTIALLAICLTANAQDSKTTVYKIADSGLQVTLPPGWNTEKDPKGTIVISKKDADGYILFSMSTLPRDPSINLDGLFAAFSEGIIENVKKDWKNFKDNPVLKDTQAGMDVRAQKLEGTAADTGGEVEGLVIVIDSAKPLGIFAQRTKKHSDLLENEGNAILSSIAKIQ
jgi:hypothetical protein